MFDVDAKDLADEAKVKVRLLRYANYILPKLPREVNFKDTKRNLEKIFDQQMSLFNRRYNCLKISKHHEDDFVSYAHAGTVNRKYEDFELAKLSADQFKALFFICGLNSSADADIRTKLLSRLDGEDANKITLDILTTEALRHPQPRHEHG